MKSHHRATLEGPDPRLADGATAGCGQPRLKWNAVAERNPDTAATVEEEGVRTMSTPDYSYNTSQDFFSQRAALPKPFLKLAKSVELYLTDFSSRCGQYEIDIKTGEGRRLGSVPELPRVPAIRDALKKAKPRSLTVVCRIR